MKRTEIRMLAIAVLVVIAITTASTENWIAVRADRLAEEHTRDLLDEANRLLFLLRRAESGQRGYLLTRKEKYLQPYVSSIEQIPAVVVNLKAFLPKNSGSERLFQLVSSKLEEIALSIDASKRVSFEAAMAIVLTDRGLSDMETIRDVIGRITAENRAFLTQNANRRRGRSTRLGLINIVGGLVLLTLLVVSVAMIQRSTERREQLIALLEEDEKRLRLLGQKAQDAEVYMRDILESIADGFMSFDKEFKIVYVNAAAERIFSRNKDEVLGKNFQAEFSEDASSEATVRYRQVMVSQLPLTFETFSSKRNAWWEQSVYPSKDGGLSVYLRDVTERKRLEERSRHTQKLESLGVLAGGIAHDFNNLLTAILGGASLLQEELPPDSEAAGHLKIVTSASERAAQLTRQMLAYSGRGRFVVEPLDLSREVREIAELLQSSVKRDVELLLRLDSGGILIEADCGQMQQLVMNLVINGAEAIENGTGSVVVSTRPEELDSEYVRDNMAGDNIIPGRYILLEVHDTGKGMDSNTLGRIFDPFFTTKFTGRGLGLAAVIGIVRGHHGAIKVYSNPGQGTTFKVFLPVAAEQNFAPAPPSKQPNLHGTETILVVDDEETVQEMALASLRKYGYQVLQARNGLEAVEIFERNPDAISLVLLDMTMPVMSGEETLKQIRQIRPDVIVIASSGYNEIEALRRFGKGVLGFLQKPYRAVNLATKIRSALTTQTSAVT